jgi:hypothetical protein
VAFQESLLKVTWQGRYPKRPVRVLFKVVNQGLLSRWPLKALVQVACQETGALFKSGLTKGLHIIVCQEP